VIMTLVVRRATKVMITNRTAGDSRG